jgi:hypothetical protein
MTKFQNTRDVEMGKFFEQPPESASLFLEYLSSENSNQKALHRFLGVLEF